MYNRGEADGRVAWARYPEVLKNQQPSRFLKVKPTCNPAGLVAREQCSIDRVQHARNSTAPRIDIEGLFWHPGRHRTLLGDPKFVCILLCCMHAWVYTHMYELMYTCTYVCRYVWMDVERFKYIHTYACMHVHVCIYVCTQVCVYEFMSMDICMYMYINTNININIYIYVYANTCFQQHMTSHVRPANETWHPADKQCWPTLFLQLRSAPSSRRRGKV